MCYKGRHDFSSVQTGYLVRSLRSYLARGMLSYYTAIIDQLRSSLKFFGLAYIKDSLDPTQTFRAITKFSAQRGYGSGLRAPVARKLTWSGRVSSWRFMRQMFAQWISAVDLYYDAVFTSLPTSTFQHIFTFSFHWRKDIEVSAVLATPVSYFPSKL